MQRGAGAAAAAVLAIALAVAGCGGEDTSTTVIVNAELTKAEFVDQGNAICKRGSEEIHSGADALKKEHGIAPNASLSKAQTEELVSDVVAPSIQSQAEGLAELGAPAGDEKEVAAIVDGLEKVAEAGGEDPGEILEVRENKGPIAEVNRAARQYGVEECTQP